MAKTALSQKWILILLGIYFRFCKAQEYEYQGCFYDFYTDRILKDLTECVDKSSLCTACTPDAPYCESRGMTIEICRDLCRAKNYQYFGLQAGGQCFCGGAFTSGTNWTPPTSPTEISRCETPCSGNQFQKCGGDYLMRVYKFQDPLANSLCYHPGASVLSQSSPSTYSRVLQQQVQDYSFNSGDTIRYTCAQRGHKVIGLSTITCQSFSGFGAWTRGPPDGCTCCAAQCSIPEIPDGALQSGNYQSPYYEGDTIEYLCYETGATYKITCLATGTGQQGAWSDIENPCKTTTRAPSTTKAPSTTRPRPPVVTPRCPNINCGFDCSYGYQQDNQGCFICSCIPPPVVTTAKPKTTRHVCQQIFCNMNCPYGLKVDTNGCTICECYYPPGVQRPPPPKVSATPKVQTAEITDQYVTATTIFNISENTTGTTGNTGLEITIPKSFSTRPSIDSLPFIVGGVAFLGLILLLVFAIGCRQETFMTKGPPPPPPDYPTIDKKYYHYSVQRREVGLVYDTIELEKRKNKKNRKNSYEQNDIPDAPPPPTISQTVSKDQGSIHSSVKSTKGLSHKSRSMQSLNRSEVSTGSRHPKSHSKTPGARSKSKAKSKPTGLSLDRSLAGGYRTPNSQTMSMSLPRGTRFIPIDTDEIDADTESYYAATISRSTVNRSVASDPQTLARSVSSEPFRSHRGKPIYHNTGTRSGQSTPKSKRRAKKGSETPNSHGRAKSSMPSTPQSPRDSGFHGSTCSVLNSPLVGSHTSLLHHEIESTQPGMTRAKSMYVNLPERDHPMTASLDRLDIRTYANTSEDHLYMDPMEVRNIDKPRLPHRAMSTEVLSTPSRYQNRMRNMGPRLHINTKVTPRYGSQQHIPPDSPFGNMLVETTTPL